MGFIRPMILVTLCQVMSHSVLVVCTTEFPGTTELSGTTESPGIAVSTGTPVSPGTTESSGTTESPGGATVTPTTDSPPLINFGTIFFDPFFSSTGQMLTWGMVNDLFQREDTIHFLDSFENETVRMLITDQLMHCPYTPLCNFSFGLPELPDNSLFSSCCKPCSCDVTCYNNDACCPDLLQLGVVSERPSTLPRSQCVAAVLDTSKWFSVKQIGYRMVTECATEADSEINKKCSGDYKTSPFDLDIDDVSPVTSQLSNVTYRNKHCADCNNVSADDVLLKWSAVLTCESGEEFEFDSWRVIIRTLMEDIPCNIEFLPVTGVHECVDSISKCREGDRGNESDTFLKWACGAYETLYTDGSYYYRNVFCARCNGASSTEPTCMVEYSSPAPHFDFSGLLNFQTTEGEKAVDTECLPGQFYDTYRQRCIQTICSEWMISKQGRCVEKYSEVKNVLYEIGINVFPVQNTTLTVANQVAGQLVEIIANRLRELLSEDWLQLAEVCTIQVLYRAPSMCSEEERCSMPRLPESLLLYYDVRVVLTAMNSMFHKPLSVQTAIIELPQMDITLKLNESVFDFSVQLKSIKPEDIPLYTLVSDMSASLSDSLLHSQVSSLNLDDLLFFKAYDDSFNVGEQIVVPFIRPNGRYLICADEKDTSRLLSLASFLDCPFVTLNKTEYDCILNTTGMIVRALDMYIDNSRFHYGETDSEILMCLEEYIKHLPGLNSVSLKRSLGPADITTIVCLSISILCLLVSLTTFTIFPQLRTLPGKNNMALMASLLIAHVLFLVGSFSGMDEDSWLCKAVGLLIHFFFLSSLFWMNACTFHMFRVFASISTRNVRAGGGHTIAVYWAYVTLLSVICVGCNITVAVVAEDGTLGYGGTACYISAPQMILFTFGIPLAFVVVTNVAMFIFVIVKIRLSPKVDKNVKNERNDLFIFAKLSTITGASWMFGFLQPWTGYVVFSYLFIVLNAGQGVLLMLAFVCNRRIFNLYLQKFTDKPGLTSSISSKYATRMPTETSHM